MTHIGIPFIQGLLCLDWTLIPSRNPNLPTEKTDGYVWTGHSLPAGIPTCNNGKTVELMIHYLEFPSFKDGYVWTGHSHIPGTLNHSFPITVANTRMSSPVSVARIMRTLIISLRLVREIYGVDRFQDN